MRLALLGALVVLLAAASGCVVWRSHLEPGVEGFPESLRDVPKSPVRLLVTARVPDPSISAKLPTRPSADDAKRLAELINEAGVASEAGVDLALYEGHVEVLLTEQGLGHPALALLTALTAGVVPYYGGKRVTAAATLTGADGRVQAEWMSVAEARLVGHLLLLTGWNLDALNDLRDDALRGVVVKLAHEQRRLLEARAPLPTSPGSHPVAAEDAVDAVDAAGAAKRR